MIDVSMLPAVNATLNSISAVLLAAGYILIRKGRIAQHQACMVAAFSTSTLFLTSYLIYHAHAGSKPFPGEGLVRALYLSILVSHVLLAAAILPLALVTLTRALRGDFVRHAAIARWTLPIWLYVSVTGVIVYWMLYRVDW